MAPAVTGNPILVLTCGSMPATRWASAISWVLIVYPALVDGKASVTKCSTRPRTRPAGRGGAGWAPPANRSHGVLASATARGAPRSWRRTPVGGVLGVIAPRYA